MTAFRLQTVKRKDKTQKRKHRRTQLQTTGRQTGSKQDSTVNNRGRKQKNKARNSIKMS